MYTTVSQPQVETCGDLWRKERYRAELAAQLPYGFGDVDAALEKLGYEVIDAGQGGRSYVNKADARHTAELDELGDRPTYVKLTLREGDLKPGEIADAEHGVESTYIRLRAECASRAAENLYDIGNRGGVSYDCGQNSPGFRFSSPRTRY